MTPPPDTPDSITRLLHADRCFGAERGGVHMAVNPSVQCGYERAEDLIGVIADFAAALDAR